MFADLCPKYMAMGMTYDEFWYTNTARHRAYRLAWEEKRKQRNWESWLQGLYVYDAIAAIAPALKAFSKAQPGKYMEEPLPLTAKEVEDRQQAKEEANLKRLYAQLERESEGMKNNG